MSLRKIDELIAEKVMGWTKGTRFWHHPWCDDNIRCTTSCGRNDPPQFSSQAVPAKQVREKLAEKWNWILGCGRTRPMEPLFALALYEKKNAMDGEEKPLFIAEGDTEELAICLCALKAHGIEIPEEPEASRS